MTHYEALELPENASAADIRSAYRRLVLLTHPDRTPDPAAHARYLVINAAYEVLSDPGRRAMYDASLLRPTSAAPSVSPRGRAREAAYRATPRPGWPRPRPDNDVGAQVRFLAVARPAMLAALVMGLSLAFDLALAREQPERVLRTDDIAYQHTIYYTRNGRFRLSEDIPLGSQVWVNRTPLWHTAIAVRRPQDGYATVLTSVYQNTSNSFWVGLIFTAFISLRPQFSNDHRIVATLLAVLFLSLTLLMLFKI